MTQNKRIILNTIATYGRSIFGVLCGIFSARWVLEALGQVDYGLYAVVGGMVVFLSFFNIQLAGAISRYYAYSIGQAKAQDNHDIGLKECRAWFTTAVLIHTIVPIVLVSVGWPLGIYALCNGWIHVPVERLNACLWVWRIVCVSSFFGMASVPFQAMYTAKQYIAEGHFAPGSMLPKVQAAVKFADSKEGRTSLITLLEKAKDGIQGKTGTRISSGR